MQQNDSNAVRTGVIGTVVGGIILALLAELFPAAKTMLTWVWKSFLAFIDLFGAKYEVAGWVIAITGVLSLISIIRFFVEFANKRAPQYTEEILYGARWRWSWSKNDLINLWCYCLNCDSELIYDDSTTRDLYLSHSPKTTFICEHCNRSAVAEINGGNKDYAIGVIQREIKRKIRVEQNIQNTRSS